eukprot:CAMPEP_0177439860 /NCGR_PEP_ID=MMETSP0369-20130122/3538_1 /TAXON_ID=447022 ORGANISM="Scrippsiella hangoei-like, Strain SHHI-4" /NCGR_SAMPLE_ID=MMETSP0369 /ASSEMBLY_ACC=CAM_ASM_000364 /LENGTH=59 /DNA_ID=CAMNT_0018911571 /DNA_START=119 /DNA_END=298 /DNA_ORIENTATION=-
MDIEPRHGTSALLRPLDDTLLLLLLLQYDDDAPDRTMHLAHRVPNDRRKRGTACIRPQK